ncbi:DUF5309 family protein [Sphingomonas sp. LY29]|uniref:SU10 major capsid protein n=1 Tax=Sphingomonas sp. LY29 TaxID=3095341 RepID=UPI002D7768D9|nr:DUF5309 family protein [Sphingomonas sp. LY29]WRP25651.1 DUF5309 family protein [Sphingomonas sp. LY29]
MAVPTNTLLTFSMVGNKESVLDKITNISPTDTPFTTMAGTATANAVFDEWQTDALAAAAQNAQLEGDDVTFAAAAPTARVGNRTQISRKEMIISGTQEAVDSYGRNSEMVYQTSKRRDEIKRDREFVLCSNQAPVTGNSATARQLRPLCGWITTNVDRGAGGANGTSSAAATDGTQRALTLAMVTTAQQNAWTQGGKPTFLMAGPKQRSVLTTVMGGAATKFYAVEDKTMTATIQAFEGDFGMVKIVTNRFVRGGQTGADREIFLLDPSLWEVAYLKGRKLLTKDLPSAGDNEKGMILSEYTLRSLQEAGNAIVADLS